MSIQSRLEQLTRTMQTKQDIPKCVCRMLDGSICVLEGMGVIQPFLDGKIDFIACNDANIANLLRALAPDIKIELVWIDGGAIRRDEI